MGRRIIEDLLGSKLAEAPEDAEMLEIIWNSQAGDVGLIVSNLNGLGDLVCMIPSLCIEGGVNQYSSFLKRYSKSANRSLRDLFEPRVRPN